MACYNEVNMYKLFWNLAEKLLWQCQCQRARNVGYVYMKHRSRASVCEIFEIITQKILSLCRCT